MIYTCTLNPAIDLFIETPSMVPEKVNRTTQSDIQANGKGVNVSFVLKMLDIQSIALGVGGGFTNQFIEDTLAARGIGHDFVHLDGTTRINVFTRVLDQQNEFKLVNPGPTATPKQVSTLLNKIAKLTDADTLVVSGSFSAGIDPTVIIKIAELSVLHKFRLIIDTSYNTVMDTLSSHPFLLKPNDEEIMSWFKLNQLPNERELIHYCQELIDQGAQNILLSLGAQGALFVSPEVILHGNAPVGTVVNTACSGDTMLGTFLAGLEQKMPLAENLQHSIAAASSTAFSMGLTNFTDVPKLMEQIKITEIKF